MSPWNAHDEDIVSDAIRYQIKRRDRGDAILPRVYVPLSCTSETQPDTAEVSFIDHHSPCVVRRFNQPRPRAASSTGGAR